MRRLIILLSTCLIALTSVSANSVEFKDITNGETIVYNKMYDSTIWTVARYMKDLRLHIDVDFKNLKEPTDRAFYEMWVENEQTGDAITLWPLELVRQNHYVGSLRRWTADTTGYNKIIITLEANDGDEAKWTHVYEAIMQDTTLEDLALEKEAYDASVQSLRDRLEKFGENVTRKTAIKLLKRVADLRHKIILGNSPTEKKQELLEILYLLDEVLLTK